MKTAFFCRCRTGALWLALAWLPLTGCLQTLPSPACGPTAQDGTDSLRVMIAFRQPVQGEAASTLEQLRARSGACVVHVSSVSAALHTYEFQGVRDAAGLTRALRTWDLVQGVTPDARVRRH